MIPFNVPPTTGKELDYIAQAINNHKLSGDGEFTKKCNQWIEENFQCKKSLLTTSCTHALEMSALLLNIQEGDEIIMPSYTFVSTANAFVLRGAKIVFVDIRPDTLNIDETLIEQAITKNTKVIVPVHYAGVACEMDTIMTIAKKYNLFVIEDAAQGVMSSYNGKALGTIGQLGCYSFHDTKNYTSGEGGALLINDDSFMGRSEIIREKGTNRSKFLRGEVDKYSWVDIGSSYLQSDITAAFLYAQFEMADVINRDRIRSWEQYYRELKPLEESGLLNLPFVPDECKHNGHLFYIKVKDLRERSQLIEFLKEHGVTSSFHFVPLHRSVAGKKFGRFHGKDQYTTKESDRLLRLPMYFKLTEENITNITSIIYKFYTKSS